MASRWRCTGLSVALACVLVGCLHGNDTTADDSPDAVGWANAALATATADVAAVRAAFVDLRGSSFTVQAWVRPGAFTENCAVFTQCDTELTDRCLWLGVVAGHPVFRFGGIDSASTTTLEADRWTHLTWVYDAQGALQRIYIAGELDVEDGSHAPATLTTKSPT